MNYDFLLEKCNRKHIDKLILYVEKYICMNVEKNLNLN